LTSIVGSLPARGTYDQNIARFTPRRCTPSRATSELPLSPRTTAET
jgi:hypothetical protein